MAGWRWVLTGALLGSALCSCSRTAEKLAALESASQADKERVAENALQQLLTEISSRQREIAALSRASGATFTPELRAKASALRQESYAPDKYLETLRKAESALGDKIAGLTAEAAVLRNMTYGDEAVTNAPPATGKADEQAEELILKSQLLEVQAHSQELEALLPSGTRTASGTRQKATAAREEYYLSDDYLRTLGSAKDILGKKLQGLAAEAAFYEQRLGIGGQTRSTNR